jgi:hypothetical protein
MHLTAITISRKLLLLRGVIKSEMGGINEDGMYDR